MDKKKSISIILTAAVFCITACCLIFSGSSEPAEASTESELAAAKQELAQIQARAEELEDELAAAQASKATQLKAKMILEEQIASLNSEISAMNAVVSAISADVDAKNAELEELASTYDEDMQAFRERARASYEAGNMSTLEILLSSDSLSEMFTRLDLVNVVAEYDRTVIEKVKTQITRTEELKAAIEANLAEQQAVMDELNSTKADLNSKQSELNRTIASLAAQETSIIAEQERYDALEEELDRKISALSSTQSPGISYLEGEFIWPLPGYSRVSSSFGWRTLYGKPNFHTGMDIPAASGTPIHAAGDGTVIQAGWVNTGGGYKVTIDHGSGLITTYCHQSRIGASVGQKVKQGDIIGYVGTTGNSTGNHLHFTIMYNGTYYDPADYVTYDNSGSRKSIQDLIGG